MNKNVLVNNQSENTKKAEKYIYKYLGEIKLHFNLTNQNLIKILNLTINKLKKEANINTWWKDVFKK